MSQRFDLKQASYLSAFLASALVGVVPLVALADGPSGGPPTEAYTACDSKAAGDACTVTFDDHTIEGTCNQRGDDARLSCKPSHRPIPQAAFDACSGKAEAAACSVTLGDHTMSGTCEKAPSGSALACRPRARRHANGKVYCRRLLWRMTSFK